MQTATVEISVRAGVPITIRQVNGWTCYGCGKPVDETRSLWYVIKDGRTRVWHPGCRR